VDRIECGRKLCHKLAAEAVPRPNLRPAYKEVFEDVAPLAALQRRSAGSARDFPLWGIGSRLRANEPVLRSAVRAIEAFHWRAVGHGREIVGPRYNESPRHPNGTTGKFKSDQLRLHRATLRIASVMQPLR